MIKKLITLLEEVLGLGDDTLKEARRRHAFWTPKMIAGFLALYALANFINWLGFPKFSYFVVMAVAAAILILASRPEPALVVLGLIEIIEEKQKTVEPGKEDEKDKPIMRIYIRPAFQILFWIAGIFAIVGTISIGENPWAPLQILVMAIVIFSGTIGFNLKFAVARRAIYAFACLMLVTSFLSLVPWTDYIGIDVFGTRDSGINAIEKKEQRRVAEAKETFLAEIERRVNRNKGLEDVLKELSPENRARYEALKEEADKRSLKKAARTWWNNVSLPRKADAGNTPPPPSPAPVYLPAMPVPAPAPPPVVVPKPVERPEWELCIENKNKYAHRTEDCSQVTVDLPEDHSEITITSVYGNKVVYRGFAIPCTRGGMDGHWNVPAPGYDNRHQQFRLDEFTPDWQYARGFRVHNDEKFTLTLRKTYSPR